MTFTVRSLVFDLSVKAGRLVNGLAIERGLFGSDRPFGWLTGSVSTRCSPTHRSRRAAKGNDQARRTPNPDDGRSVLASLTPAGAKAAEAATLVLNARTFSALPISGDDRDGLYQLLRDVRRAYGDFE